MKKWRHFPKEGQDPMELCALFRNKKSLRTGLNRLFDQGYFLLFVKKVEKKKTSPAILTNC